MKIVHISDIHIRNRKYSKEYNAAFQELKNQLELIKPDLVINTGDTVHSKLSVTPELFDDLVKHFMMVCEIAPYWVILGNHDLNLKNLDRTDAISPVVRALQGKTKHELRIPSAAEEKMLQNKFQNFSFWNFDIRDENITFKISEKDNINIGLYHGSVNGCVNDTGFELKEVETNINKFENMDFVLLGDIHKMQKFRNNTIAYPGSLIQQNFGESLVKGFLLWDIKSKKDFTSEFIELKNIPHRFYTLNVDEIGKANIPKESRIRLIINSEILHNEKIEIEKKIKILYNPIELTIIDSFVSLKKIEKEIDKLLCNRTDAIKHYLLANSVKSKTIDDVINLFNSYEKNIDNEKNYGSTWSLNKISWDNMFNYGKQNSINFENLKGIVGIFAKNATGKSSIFDVVLQTLFDKTTKDIPRNVDIVNNNCDYSNAKIEFLHDGKKYFIERSIEKISDKKDKEWGKTKLSLYHLDENNNQVCLNGENRQDTEKVIRQLIGNFEDFIITSMITQNTVFGTPGGGDIINCKDTDRKKILSKILDLDVYDKIYSLAKDDYKQILFETQNKSIDEIKNKKNECKKSIDDLKVEIQISDEKKQINEKEIEKYSSFIKNYDFESLKKKLRDCELSENKTTALISDVSKNIKNINKDIEDCNNKKDYLDREISLIPVKNRFDEDIENIEIIIKQIRNDLEIEKENKIKQQLNADNKNKELLQISASKKKLEGIPCGNMFPSCKFISDAVITLGKEQELIDCIDSLKNSIIDIEKNVAEWYTKSIFYESLLSHKKNTQFINEKLKYLNENLNSALQNYDNLKFDLKKIQENKNILLDEINSKNDYDVAEKITNIKKANNSIANDIFIKYKNIGVLEQKINELDTDIENLNSYYEKAVVIEKLIDVCSKNGLQYTILSSILPLINSEINKVLSELSKFSISIEDNEDKAINIFIKYNDGRVRPVSLASGAEKFITSIAIKMALSNVSSLPKSSIMIIDEGFGKLDSENLDNIEKLFQQLKLMFGTVFIVSHIDSMKDIVDYLIEIEHDDTFAHIEV